MSVQQKIDEVADGKSTVLQLQYMRMSSLPVISHLTLLQELLVTGAGLRALPILPSGLRTLCASYNDLRTLPTLPSTLQTLDISHNCIHTLPDLPSGLRWLYIHHTKIQVLPDLPSGLQEIYAGNGDIQTIPDLPQTLQTLYVFDNKLQMLPKLPLKLQELSISYNNLGFLPDLSHLAHLRCIIIGNNPFTHSHINNAVLSCVLDKVSFSQCDIDAFNAAILLFSDKTTYFSLLPRDVTNIIKGYISYVPVVLKK